MTHTTHEDGDEEKFDPNNKTRPTLEHDVDGDESSTHKECAA